MSRPLRLVPTLFLAVGSLAAADGTSPFALGGARLPASNDRLVYIHGLLDLDYFGTGNTTDGDNDRSDNVTTPKFRGEMGVRVELDERIEAKLTVAYAARAGDTDNSANDGVVMDDAYVVLKELFNQNNLSLKAGRQPQAWNLRTDQGAWLFDSRANQPDITSWDGARLQWGANTLVFTPFAYLLPDSSDLYGIAVDWQPVQAAANGLFLTGSFNLQKDALTTETGLPVLGDKLYTWTGGIELRLSTWDLYGEGAFQTGDLDEDTEYGGFGFYVGAEWHPRTSHPQLYGIQYDWISGDKTPGDRKMGALVNPWEGQEDTLIVENEKYGEIGSITQDLGLGLHALKLVGEWGLDQNGRVKARAVFAWYQFDADRTALDKDFGKEGDLSLNWQYNQAANAFLGLFGAIFIPGDGFQDTAPDQPADTDPVWLFGTNLLVHF